MSAIDLVLGQSHEFIREPGTHQGFRPCVRRSSPSTQDSGVLPGRACGDPTNGAQLGRGRRSIHDRFHQPRSSRAHQVGQRTGGTFRFVIGQFRPVEWHGVGQNDGVCVVVVEGRSPQGAHNATDVAKTDGARIRPRSSGTMVTVRKWSSIAWCTHPGGHIRFPSALISAGVGTRSGACGLSSHFGPVSFDDVGTVDVAIRTPMLEPGSPDVTGSPTG